MKRLITIGDIHGMLNEFKKMLAKIELSKDDTLVLLGDYVDRGYDMMGVILEIVRLQLEGYNIVPLMGNHDIMLLLQIENPSPQNIAAYEKHGYYSYREYCALSEKDKLIVRHFLQHGHFLYETSQYLFVHAGVPADRIIDFKKELPYEDMLALIEIRSDFYNNKHNYGKIVVFGHTSTCLITNSNEAKIWYGGDKIGMDCGAAFKGGKLAALDLTTGQEYYVGNKLEDLQ